MYRQWMALYFNSVSKEKKDPEDFYKFPEEIEDVSKKELLTAEQLKDKADEFIKARKGNG